MCFDVFSVSLEVTLVPDSLQLSARVGSVLAGKYRLTRLLGAGGMGAVFDAVNTWTERRVAVKLMLGDGARDPELAARFLREARAASRIQHPSVVDILDMGQDPVDGALFIVQEFLQGTDLRSVLEKRGALPAQEALEIVTPVMAALVAAHSRGVVHRDLKPENIFLAKTTAGVVPKLIDFGIARLTEPGSDALLTRTGSAVGTPLYMSPEQAKGERDVDAQSDVWAMGVVLFECMSGCVPFEGANYNAVIAAIMMGAIPRLDVVAPSVPHEIADVVARALTRERSSRYRSIQQFLGELLECPTYKAESWHQALRSTHRTALEPLPAARDTLDEELIVTPQIASPRSISTPYSEGRSWMTADLVATTLGRTGREIAAPSRSTPRAWLVPTALLALLGVGAFVGAVSLGGHSRSAAHVEARVQSHRVSDPHPSPSSTPAVPTAVDSAAPASVTNQASSVERPAESLADPGSAGSSRAPPSASGPGAAMRRPVRGIAATFSEPRHRGRTPVPPTAPTARSALHSSTSPIAPTRASAPRVAPVRNGAPVLEQ